MRILILGGNGFIGSAVARMLVDRGHRVTALARDVAVAARRMPDANWVRADIAHLAQPADWLPILGGIEAVVNCAGALQDGARDNVTALQEVAMSALYEAAYVSGIKRIIQISAQTEGGAADTPFLATKRSADAALKNSGVPFVILRPAVVIGRNAHGGSALLRALAAFPCVLPLIYASAPMQFAAVDDVVEAVAEAIEGEIPPDSDLVIAAPETLTLGQAVARHRSWLGLRPAPIVAVPGFAARVVGLAADLLGYLGWRSPLRSTALAAAAIGVTALPPAKPWRKFRSLDETLRAAPAGVQDLWFARFYLLKPLIFGTLGLFWLLSGIIAITRFGESSAYLVEAGATHYAATFLTVLTSLLDMALGIGVAIRRHAKLALKLMIVASLAYLAGATILQPFLWVDPLGPLMKVLPSIVLALAALAILDER